MPINLLSGEGTDTTTKEKPTNLLPEVTAPFDDSKGSVVVPEKSPQEPFINDIYNALMSGVNGLWANSARVPAGVYDLAAMPQNFLVKAIGRPELQVQSPEWLMNNPIAELYDYQTQAFEKDITPTKTLEEALKTKDFDGIGRHLAIQVVKNAPQQIGIILSYMAGYPGAGLTGMGLLATTDVLKEGRKNKKDPAMNAYNALTHGVVEAGFESIGTMGILKKWSKTLAKSFGTKNAKIIIGDVFKTIFHSMLGEGNEELWTSLAQDFSSFATGIDENALKGSLPRAFEAGAVGAISGGLLTGPGAITTGAKSASLKKMQDDVNAVTKKLREEAQIPLEEGQVEPGARVEGEVEEIIRKIEALVDYGIASFGADIGEDTAGAKFELSMIKKDAQKGFSDVDIANRHESRNKGKVFRNTSSRGATWNEVLDWVDEIRTKKTTLDFDKWLSQNRKRAKVPGKPSEVPGIEAKPGVGEAIPGVEGVGAGVKPIEVTVTESTIKPDAKKQTPLEKEIESLEFREDKVDASQRAIIQGEAIFNTVQGTLEEIAKTKDIPQIRIGELLTELNAEAGTDFQNIEDLKEFERNWKSEKKFLEKIVKEVKPEIIAKKETTILKEKIRDIERGIREGKVMAKQDIKAVQTDIINMLEASDLAAADKAKFIRKIKNIQTGEQLQKALPDIKQTISRLETAAEKRGVSAKIKKELKTTKPLKVGQRRVGKFDPESNKVFDTLRDFNKLTQEKAQAEFDKFPDEVDNEMDLIKKRFLSLKANGAAASVEIHEQVLADIQRIKKLGKESKDLADLIKRINRQERVDSALSSIDKITGSKDTVLGKVVNIYRKGFSNIYSMFNSIAGKDFAEAYNPEKKESRRNTAVFDKTLDVTVAASEIYNEKNIMRLFETMSLKDYEITDTKDGLTTKITKLDLIDIYNSIKNDKKRADYYEAFGEDQVQNLMGSLTSKDTAFGDALQEAVQQYREILNKRSIETTGRDLGFIENYWPATSEFAVSVIDDMRVQGETPSALKERAKSPVIPVPKNAWYKAQKHIAQAEHVDNLSREYETLKRLFNDRRVKHAVTQKYGEDVYNTIIAQIDNISLNKQTERIDFISGRFQKLINNWVTAKIAINPTTYVRQLMSVGNYIENMNPVEWTTGFFKGITSPRDTFNFMWNNAPFLKARFNKGYSEALKEAIEGAERMSVNKQEYTKFLTALVRSGDITAIIYGGFPLVKAELAKGKSMKEAIDVLEQATLKSQQSGLSSSISQFQNSRNPFTRLFLAFKNTSNQYFRKMVDATISFQNGDISAGQYAKTMSIYAVIQPIMYVAAGHATSAAFGLLGSAFGLREPDDPEELIEKFLNAVMIQLIVSPVNAIPIIDDVVQTAARKVTGQKIYKIFSTPLFDDLEKGFRALTKKEVTGKDYLDATTSILVEPITAFPLKTGIRYYEILTGKKVIEKKSGKKLIR